MPDHAVLEFVMEFISRSFCLCQMSASNCVTPAGKGILERMFGKGKGRSDISLSFDGFGLSILENTDLK